MPAASSPFCQKPSEVGGICWKTEVWEKGRTALNQKYQGEVNEKVCDLVSMRESKLPIARGVLAENRGQETEGSVRKDLEIGANSIWNNDINIK